MLEDVVPPAQAVAGRAGFSAQNFRRLRPRGASERQEREAKEELQKAVRGQRAVHDRVFQRTGAGGARQTRQQLAPVKPAPEAEKARGAPQRPPSGAEKRSPAVRRRATRRKTSREAGGRAKAEARRCSIPRPKRRRRQQPRQGAGQPRPSSCPASAWCRPRPKSRPARQGAAVLAAPASAAAGQQGRRPPGQRSLWPSGASPQGSYGRPADPQGPYGRPVQPGQGLGRPAAAQRPVSAVPAQPGRARRSAVPPRPAAGPHRAARRPQQGGGVWRQRGRRRRLWPQQDARPRARGGEGARLQLRSEQEAVRAPERSRARASRATAAATAA